MTRQDGAVQLGGGRARPAVAFFSADVYSISKSAQIARLGILTYQEIIIGCVDKAIQA